MAISLHVSDDGLRIQRRDFCVDLSISEYEKLIKLSDDISRTFFDEEETQFHLSDTSEVNSKISEGRKNIELINVAKGVQVLIIEKDEWFALDKYFMAREMELGKDVFKKFLITVIDKNLYRACDGCLEEGSVNSTLHQCLNNRYECAAKILNSSALTKISIPRFVKKLTKEAYRQDVIIQYPVAIYKRVVLHYKSCIKEIVLNMYSNSET